jgi:hypothetical protein
LAELWGSGLPQYLVASFWERSRAVRSGVRVSVGRRKVGALVTRRTPDQLLRDRHSVLACLSGDWQATSAVADCAGQERSVVGRDLRWWLERGPTGTGGYVQRRNGKSPKTLLFAPGTGEVLTEENYEELKASGQELRSFHPEVAEWRLTKTGQRARWGLR